MNRCADGVANTVGLWDAPVFEESASEGAASEDDSGSKEDEGQREGKKKKKKKKRKRNSKQKKSTWALLRELEARQPASGEPVKVKTDQQSAKRGRSSTMHQQTRSRGRNGRLQRLNWRPVTSRPARVFWGIGSGGSTSDKGLK